MYDAIYSAMEQEMVEHGLLGGRLNTIPSKTRMHNLSSMIYTRFPSVFDPVPQAWKDRCLLAMAQKCNYNQKRRVSQRPLRRTDPKPTPEPPQALPDAKYEDSIDSDGPTSQRLDSILIYVYHQDAQKATLCRPQDFLTTATSPPAPGTATGPAPPRPVRDVNDLHFCAFERVLADDVGYDSARDQISYVYGDGQEIVVRSERAWRSALDYMHRAGVRPHFPFAIRRRPPPAKPARPARDRLAR
jgi:hypothetical protein